MTRQPPWHLVTRLTFRRLGRGCGQTPCSPAPVAGRRRGERGDAAAFQALLKDGADVNAAQADGMTALHWTALNGDVKTLNVLLIAGR